MGDPALNIIVPIGGLGTRFAKQGYRFPKPLINIIGRPMLLWLIDNLSIRPEDTLWIAVNEHVDDEFRIGQLVAKSLPKVDLRMLRLRHQTKGASETLYMVTQSMGRQHLDRKTVSLDCDTIYWADVLQRIRDMPAGHGGCFYFEDRGDKPIFSYIKTAEQGSSELILDIAEKRAISNKANTGAYVFASARLLREWAATSLDIQHDVDVGEYYTSQMIMLMLEQGRLPFLGIQIALADFSCVGTPEQLEELLAKLKSSSHSDTNNNTKANGHARGISGTPGIGRIVTKRRRFCFDLDSTLVGVPQTAGDYSTCPPIERNIRLVQQLYEAGHYIIIQTARRMRTHHGNVGAVMADVGKTTFDQLDRYHIPYHDIHFGKPYADVYIDDLAVNANMDTMREIGWLLDDVVLDKPTGAGTTGMIASRDFNTIQTVGDKIIKSSKSANILGELFFYSHMPPPLRLVVPAVHAVDFLETSGMYSVTMESIKGMTYSHLLVGRSMTRGRLLLLLRALHKIHHTRTGPASRPESDASGESESESDPEEAGGRSGPGAGPGLGAPTLDIPPALAAHFEAHSLEHAGNHVNIYANYATKLRTRYHQHRERYDALGPLAASLFSRLHEFLDTYEAEDKGVHAHVIHGDAVFSNAILAHDGRAVRFVDVRCQLEDTLTPEGDVHYDLAKVLQSLCGYDHILFLLAESERDHTRHESLRALSQESAQVLNATAAELQPGKRLRAPNGVANRHSGTNDIHRKRELPSLLGEADRNLLDEMQEHFFAFIKEEYSVRIHPKTLFRITASLLFSLIPLHREELGPIFLRLCSDTLDKAVGIQASSLVPSASHAQF